MTSDDNESATNPNADEDSNGILDNVVPALSKTPFYEACQAPRYQRQALIRDIQRMTGSKLICYVAGPVAPVDQ